MVSRYLTYMGTDAGPGASLDFTHDRGGDLFMVAA